MNRTRRAVQRRAALRSDRRRRRLTRMLLVALAVLLPAVARAQDGVKRWKTSDGVECRYGFHTIWCADGFEIGGGGGPGWFKVPSEQHPEPTPSPTPTPTPAKVWRAYLEAGPATQSTPEELKPYGLARLTVSGDPWKRVSVFARGDLARTTNGSAFSLDDFTSFASIEALAGARYRLANLPVSVGAIGAVTWSRESDVKSPRDPRLWTIEGIACIERFSWWPEGGLACIGVGRRGPVGGAAASVSITFPIKGGVSTVVDFDLPFNKLPEVPRALPGAARSAPLPTGPRLTPPTAEEIRGVAQRLPIAVRVGAVVRLRTLGF